MQPAPLTLQTTAVFDVPVTEAANCWWPPTGTVADVGVSVIVMGGKMVTLAVLDLVGSAFEVTVTETCAGVGTEGGAK